MQSSIILSRVSDINISVHTCRSPGSEGTSSLAPIPAAADWERDRCECHTMRLSLTEDDELKELYPLASVCFKEDQDSRSQK